MVVAVDFDGTIVEHRYPEIGPEVQGAFKALWFMRSKGVKLILWTCRSGQELQDAVEFCRSKGLEFDAVNDNVDSIGFAPKPKVYADLYIDDRAYMGDSVLDWKRILYYVLSRV